MDTNNLSWTNFPTEYIDDMQTAMNDFNRRINAVLDEFERQFGQRPKSPEVEFTAMGYNSIIYSMYANSTINDMGTILTDEFDNMMESIQKKNENLVDSSKFDSYLEMDNNGMDPYSTGTFHMDDVDVW